jgi:hypothetical protein
VQSEAIGPPESYLRLVLSSFSPLSKNIAIVFLEEIAVFDPAAVGGLNPFNSICLRLVRGTDLIGDPVVGGPHVGSVPLLSGLKGGGLSIDKFMVDIFQG